MKVHSSSNAPAQNKSPQLRELLSSLAQETTLPLVPKNVDAGYFVLEIGNRRLKNAVSLLNNDDLIVFFTSKPTLVDALRLHGFKVENFPFEYESSHNINRYKVEGISETSVKANRDLFLMLMIDSAQYVESSK